MHIAYYKSMYCVFKEEADRCASFNHTNYYFFISCNTKYVSIAARTYHMIFMYNTVLLWIVPLTNINQQINYIQKIGGDYFTVIPNKMFYKGYQNAIAICYSGDRGILYPR